MIDFQQEVMGPPKRVDYISIYVKGWYIKELNLEGGSFCETHGQIQGGDAHPSKNGQTDGKTKSG